VHILAAAAAATTTTMIDHHHHCYYFQFLLGRPVFGRSLQFIPGPIKEESLKISGRLVQDIIQLPFCHPANNVRALTFQYVCSCVDINFCRPTIRVECNHLHMFRTCFLYQCHWKYIVFLSYHGQCSNSALW